MGCHLFSSDSTDFNENRIANIITALMLMIGVNGPLDLVAAAVEHLTTVSHVTIGIADGLNECTDWAAVSA